MQDVFFKLASTPSTPSENIINTPSVIDYGEEAETHRPNFTNLIVDLILEEVEEHLPEIIEKADDILEEVTEKLLDVVEDTLEDVKTSVINIACSKSCSLFYLTEKLQKLRKFNLNMEDLKNEILLSVKQENKIQTARFNTVAEVIKNFK